MYKNAWLDKTSDDDDDNDADVDDDDDEFVRGMKQLLSLVAWSQWMHALVTVNACFLSSSPV